MFFEEGLVWFVELFEAIGFGAGNEDVDSVSVIGKSGFSPAFIGFDEDSG